MRPRILALLLLGAALALALAAPARAQTPPSQVVSGHALADRYCARCHKIAPDAQGTWTDAPAFDAIANRPGTTAAKLGAFIRVQHVDMLDTGRPPAEADALAGYIMSLRHR